MSRFLAFLLLVLVVPVLAGCGSEPPPLLTEAQIAASEEHMKDQSKVLDAGISQREDNGRISLVLIVDHGTTESSAKALGKYFVRWIKAEFEPEDRDIEVVGEIGKTIYDYRVGVFYPDRSEIVSGAKVTIAREITW